MEKYIYKINQNDKINVWKYDDLNFVPFESEPAVFENKEHYYNIGVTATKMEEIAQIIYPVREKFLNENFLEKATYEKREYKHLYFPWENSRVEFSGFNHCPTLRSANFQSFIEAEEEGEYNFSIKVTGGIKIWVNGEKQVQFGEYVRNCGSYTNVTLNLKKGENEIVAYTDDLSERDIFYYFEMTYIDTKPLSCYVYLNEPKALEHSVNCLKAFYLLEDECTPDNCKFGFNKDVVKEGFSFYLKTEDQTFILKAESVAQYKKYTISKEDYERGYILVDDFFSKDKLGGHYIKLVSNVSGVFLERRLFVLTYLEENLTLVPEKTLQQRKQQAIEYLYKYKASFISRVLPTLEKGLNLTEEDEKFFYDCLKDIDNRLDCADFRLPIIMMIVEKYSHLLKDELLAEIKRVSLNFRYWIDEKGKDVMWFFSENHAFLFHACQYLTGQVYENETFISGLSSKEQKERGFNRLVEWFEEFLSVGYDEWNSTTYLPVDFIGFFTLFEVAKDEKIKNFAKDALDISFEIIASNVHRNTYATSYGRTYEKQLKSAKLAELSMISWIAFGYGSTNNRDLASSLFATSSYEPKNYDKLLNTENNSVTVERLQGRNKVYTYIHKRKEYALGSVIQYNPFKNGMQQHVINLTLGDEHKNIVSWINHPGEKSFSGDFRPSYWAGNANVPLVEQHENLCLLSTKIDPEKDVHYIHSYMPINSLCEYKQNDKWFFGRVNNSYVALYFNNGYEIVEKGANTHKEIISYGLENVVVLKCGSVKEHGTFEEFVQKCSKSKVNVISVSNFIFEDFEYGTVEVKLGENLKINNKEILREAKKEGIVTIK